MGLLLVSTAGAAEAPSVLCEGLLSSGKLVAAMYKIDIGGGDEGGYGEVVVIRDSDRRHDDRAYDRERPEMGNDDNEAPKRPDYEMPHEEPQLEIVTPTRKEKERLPAIMPLINPDEIPSISPVKKPNKPLPN